MIAQASINELLDRLEKEAWVRFAIRKARGERQRRRYARRYDDDHHGRRESADTRRQHDPEREKQLTAELLGVVRNHCIENGLKWAEGVQELGVDPELIGGGGQR